MEIELKLKDNWDNSYENGDNRTFWPIEEVVRLFSRYVVKRADFNKFNWMSGFNRGSKMLDFGCGAGRHLKFGLEIGLDVYGVDLSEKAVKFAGLWLKNAHPQEFKSENLAFGENSLRTFNNERFDVILAASCLDSMPFITAKNFMKQFRAQINSSGILFFDVVCGLGADESRGDFLGEKVITNGFENGTIQSYFDNKKIDELLDGGFKIVEKILVTTTDEMRSRQGSRYFVACKPN